MEKRAACLKVLGIITIIIYTIFNLALLTYRLIDKNGNKNKASSNQQSPQNRTKGLDIFLSNEELYYIDMKKEWKNSYGFDILKDYKTNEKEKEFKKNYHKSKSIKKNAGIYWVSDTNIETEAKAKANSSNKSFNIYIDHSFKNFPNEN